MKIVLTGRRGLINELNKIVEDTVSEVAAETEATAKSNTPVRTGYTRGQWKQKKSKQQFKIENKVAWIERLEAGASKQAPRGIIGPTLTSLKGKVK